MPHTPPSDPADHAEDFSRRYAEDLDIAAGDILMGLGIDPKRLGATDPEDLTYKTFHPGERTVGSLTPDGRITLDSGVMNPEAMDAPYGEEAGDHWRSKMRLRDRMQAASAHEFEEHEGGSHEAALKRGPDTALPVSEPAREMLRKMRDGWKGR
jgi:hypothetical protein